MDFPSLGPLELGMYVMTLCFSWLRLPNFPRVKKNSQLAVTLVDQGVAIPNQDSAKLSASPCFARVRFCSPVFCPFFVHFLPENGQKVGKKGQFRFCLFLPKFARIRSFSFVVRMRRSLLPVVDTSCRFGFFTHSSMGKVFWLHEGLESSFWS